MAGKNTAVFGIYKNRVDLEHAVDTLRGEGFRSSDISVLFPDNEGTKDFAHEKHTKAPEGTATGATTGAVLGGVLGWLTGIGALAIPGIGPFIAAGPIMAALAGAGVGGTVGGLTGALIGAGIPEYEAKRYEGKLREGNILISVHTEDAKERARARSRRSEYRLIVRGLTTKSSRSRTTPSWVVTTSAPPRSRCVGRGSPVFLRKACHTISPLATMGSSIPIIARRWISRSTESHACCSASRNCSAKTLSCGLLDRASLIQPFARPGETPAATAASLTFAVAPYEARKASLRTRSGREPRIISRRAAATSRIGRPRRFFLSPTWFHARITYGRAVYRGRRAPGALRTTAVCNHP